MEEEVLWINGAAWKFWPCENPGLACAGNSLKLASLPSVSVRSTIERVPVAKPMANRRIYDLKSQELGKELYRTALTRNSNAPMS